MSETRPNREMAEDIRPTTFWRAMRDKEAQEWAAGLITAQEGCIWARLFPNEFLDRIERVLDAFAAAIAALPATPDAYPGVMRAIETTVLALNEINESGCGGGFDSGERELLCNYIDEIIIRHGVDIDALANSQNVERYELTDEWRDW